MTIFFIIAAIVSVLWFVYALHALAWDIFIKDQTEIKVWMPFIPWFMSKIDKSIDYHGNFIEFYSPKGQPRRPDLFSWYALWAAASAIFMFVMLFWIGFAGAGIGYVAIWLGYLLFKIWYIVLPIALYAAMVTLFFRRKMKCKQENTPQ